MCTHVFMCVDARSVCAHMFMCLTAWSVYAHVFLCENVWSVCALMFMCVDAWSLCAHVFMCGTAGSVCAHVFMCENVWSACARVHVCGCRRMRAGWRTNSGAQLHLLACLRWSVINAAYARAVSSWAVSCLHLLFYCGRAGVMHAQIQ